MSFQPAAATDSPGAGRLMPLEILHVAFVLFGCSARFEGTEIATLAGLGIDLARIETVFA